MRLFVVFAFILALADHASAADDLVKPFWLPSKPKESNSQTKDRSEAASRALEEFKSLTFLQSTDAKSYQQSIQTLIGNYFYIKDPGTKNATIVLVGQGSASKKEIKTELKDSVIFKGIIKKQWNAGLTLPFLAVTLGNDEVAELTIQDIVAVVAERPLATEIGCGFPSPWLEDAKTKEFYYLTAASVTRISYRRFNSESEDGSGAFSIVKLGGKFFYSNEELYHQNIIAISKIPAKPWKGEDCKEFKPKPEPAKTAQPLTIPSVTKEVTREFSSPFITKDDVKIPNLTGAPFAIAPVFE